MPGLNLWPSPSSIPGPIPWPNPLAQSPAPILGSLSGPDLLRTPRASRGNWPRFPRCGAAGAGALPVSGLARVSLRFASFAIVIVRVGAGWH